MVVVTRLLYENPWGGFRKGPTEEVEGEFMQEAARRSMKETMTPKYRLDPSYNWAKNRRTKD